MNVDKTKTAPAPDKTPDKTPAKPETCHHCGRTLPRTSDGLLSYWSEQRAGPHGWPVSVRVCRNCRYLYPQEEDTHNGNQ